MNKLNYTENLLHKIEKLEEELKIQQTMAFNLNELRIETNKKIREAFVSLGGLGIEEDSDPVDVLIAHYCYLVELRKKENK